MFLKKLQMPPVDTSSTTISTCQSAKYSNIEKRAPRKIIMAESYYCVGFLYVEPVPLLHEDRHIQEKCLRFVKHNQACHGMGQNTLPHQTFFGFLLN
jgi:hypothetical protein